MKSITQEQGKTLPDAEGDVLRGLRESICPAPIWFLCFTRGVILLLCCLYYRGGGTCMFNHISPTR